MQDLEQQKQHFENISQRYFEARQGEKHLLLKDLMWSYFFKDKGYLVKPKLMVLEPMCGHSEGKKLIEKYLTTDIVYEGFDYSSEMVKYAKQIDPSINVYELDATKFQSEPKYDLIIIIGGLHHVPNYVPEVLKNLQHSLNPEGYLICLEPTHNNWLFRKVRERIYKKNSLFDQDTERAFELSDLNKKLKDAGFEIRDQMHPGLSSYVLFYNPDAFPWLGFGGKWLVRFLFGVDKLFFRNWVGRKFAFATLTLVQKAEA